MLKTGLTSRTIKSLQLNAGVLLKTWSTGGSLSEENIICATRGGGSFSAVQEMHQAAVDGAPTYTKGLERIDGWTVTLSTTAVEINAKALKLALGLGASVTNEEGSDSQDSVLTGNLSVNLTDYQDVYWVGDLSDGRNVVIQVKNAINTSGLNLTFADKGEGTYALSLVGHFDATDLIGGKQDAPFKVTIEKKVEV